MHNVLLAGSLVASVMLLSCTSEIESGGHGGAAEPGDASTMPGGQIVADGGARVSPDGGAPVSPDSGARVSPDGGAPVSPDSGAPVSPDGGASSRDAGGTTGADAVVPGADGGSVTPVSPCADDAVPLTGTGPAFFVATNGSDGNDGSAAHPFATLTRAAQAAQPGSVVTVKGGTYMVSQSHTITAQGTASQPIIFRVAAGESVVFDASGSSDWAPFAIRNAAWVVADGFEVRNTAGYGVLVESSHDIVVQHCSFHDTHWNGVFVMGTNIKIVDNEIYRAVLGNENGSMGSGGWGCGIESGQSNGALATGFLVSGNHVHDIWGECINSFFVDGAIIRRNRVHDCYSVSIYNDHARNVTVEGNLIYETSDTYARRDSGSRAQALQFSVEYYDGDTPFALENITVKNNLIVGTNTGFAYWHDGRVGSAENTYRNLRIINNTVVGTTSGSVMQFDSASGTPSGVFANNIALGAAYVGNPGAWTFEHNDWGPGGVPAAATGTGNLAQDPGFVSPVPGGPVEGYDVGSGSPCRGAGAPQSDVLVDFACVTRSATHPTLGFLEQ
jgi:hypothetical protein